MDAFGSMNSLRDDAATIARSGKTASARLGESREHSKGAFEDLLSAVATSAMPAPIQPIVAQAAPTMPEQPSESAATETNASLALTETKAAADPTAVPIGFTPLNQLMAAPPQESAAAGIVLAGVEAADMATSSTTPPIASNLTNVLGEGANSDLLSQLAALASDESGSPTSSSVVTTNAANLSASRSNAGAMAAQLDTASADVTSVASTTLTPSSAAATISSNDNATPALAGKPRTIDLEVGAKAPTQTLEPVSTTTDGAGSTSVISGQEVTAPANDQANRPSQLTPQTIPMLAATMMRRFDSGSRQFTMRLDPPELGQVEVKLTVAADKKVRAVVSADRPEALADLVRSARELVRALHEAGLDLEENGLTFQMNDPSNGQQQNARDHQSSQTGAARLDQKLGLDTEIQVVAERPATPNDPFQRWQRARIALTV